jgi:hypothetical protein
MILCDVVVETDLPDTWINFAANNGKRDREIIEFAFHSKATELHMQDWAPVVTTNLARKITTLRIVSSNMDDLDQGINPFSVVIVDNTTSPAEAAYRAATKVALKYDDLTKGVGVPLADLTSSKPQTLSSPTRSR